MFLRNAWYVGAWDTEVGRQNLLRRTLLNEPVVFYRQEVGDMIQCPYHGLEYNADGNCVRVPGQSTVPPGCRVRSYPVVERNHWIWLWMGDPELANPDDIEDFHWMDHPDWRAKGELMHLKADYRLLVENLLDLSHLSYIHATTLGTSAVAETPMSVDRSDRHVTVTTTHYFWAQAHDFRIDEPWITDLLVANIHEAFLEDLEIIGLQQINIDSGTTRPRIDINHDGGGLQAIRTLEAMIEAENDPGSGRTAQAAE